MVGDEEVDDDEVVKVKGKKGKKGKRSKQSQGEGKGKGESEDKVMGTKAKGSKNQSPPESDKESSSKEGGKKSSKVYIGVRQQSFGLNSTSMGMRQGTAVDWPRKD